MSGGNQRARGAPDRPKLPDIRTDSQQLQRLRFSFHYARPDERASPARLGAYAAEKQRTVTDFGEHSARWVELFTRAHQKHLKLFKA